MTPPRVRCPSALEKACVGAGLGLGFTLLELLLVLVISAAVATVALPRLSGAVAAVELKGAARTVASELRQARMRAVVEGREVAFYLDVDRRTFWSTDMDKLHALPAGLHLKVVTANSEVASAEVGGIRFFADGSSTGGRITLGVGERAYVVDIGWLTGRVTIHD